MVLEQSGYSVLTAGNCAEALAICERHAVSLVITDHLLEHESELDLIADLKRLQPQLPVVMLSGMPPESMDNIDCFICKGEPIRSALSILRDLLNR